MDQIILFLPFLWEVMIDLSELLLNYITWKDNNDRS